MGNSRAYVISEEITAVPQDEDPWLERPRIAPRSQGPEMLSIVRVGSTKTQWIVVSISTDRRTVSIAPLNQGASVGMKHGISVTKLWPYYGQVDVSA